MHATAVFAAVEQGDSERAVRSVQAAAAAAARYGDCPTCSALLNPVAAEAFALLADPESARVTPTRPPAWLRRSAVRRGARWPTPPRGSAAVAAGDAPAARRHFGSARERYALAGHRFRRPRTSNRTQRSCGSWSARACTNRSDRAPATPPATAPHPPRPRGRVDPTTPTN